MTKPQFFALLGACVATLLLAILDISIVTSTGAAIARDIDPHGGLSQVPWLVAIYALVSTVVQPLYGKLADTAGPKVVYLVTVGLFIAGSLLCAAATSMALAAAGLVLAAAFGYRQTHSPAPFFPLRLLRHRTLRVVSVLQLATGCGMAAATIYVTLDLELVRHIAAASVGLLLLPMAAGLALGAAGGSLILARARSVRPSILASTALCALALGGLALTSAGTPLVVLLTLLLVLGLGVGFGIGNEMIIVQNSVERRDLGTATTGVRFTETLGASVAAAAFATLFTAGTAHGHLGPGPVMGTLDLIFTLGAGLLAVATVIGMWLPRDRVTKTPGGQLGHTQQPV